MLVFIDESGDPGFKVAKGSSSLFVAAMVILSWRRMPRRPPKKSKRCRPNCESTPSSSSVSAGEVVRDEFFRTVASRRFVIRAIVVPKPIVYSPHLRSNKEDFYRYFVKSMIKNDGGWLQDAKVIIDGSGDRTFRRDLKAYLRRETPPGCIRDVQFRSSRGDPLVQLADMCVGAIARSYREKRKDAGKWRAMLAKRIDNVWEFK